MTPVSLHLEAGVDLPGESGLLLAADIFLPQDQAPSTILVCFPGGGMNRRYWNLQAEGDASFSFACAMTARGFAVAAVDHLGVGGSSRPADSYALTHEVLARANAHVTGAILDGLRAGTLLPGVAALPDLKSIVVGHSMGAMFAIVQQALQRQHAGVAALGFSTRGLPEFVPLEAQELARDPALIRAELPRLARALFVHDYPVIQPSPQANGIYCGSAAEPTGVQALKAATDRLLPIPAYLSMIPGNVAPEAAAIDVPVFLAVGERDMAGRPHRIPAAFTASRDVTLQILDRAGHSHFLFASRIALFDRLAAWTRMVASSPTSGRRPAGPA